MLEVINLSLPADLKACLEARSQIESIPSTELIEQAIREYLLVGRFRSLRAKMLETADQQGGYSDEDIFAMVS
jgi:metal-responsive CopG/Arc/MetJ family transcriptional regulator